MGQLREDSSNDSNVVGIANDIPGKSGVYGYNPAAGGNGIYLAKKRKLS